MAIGNSLLRISAQKEVSDFPFCTRFVVVLRLGYTNCKV